MNIKCKVSYAVLFLSAIVFADMYKFNVMAQSPYIIVDYIKANEKDSPISFMLEVNDEPLISVNPFTKMPLASTFKLTLAVEYARQVGEKMLKPHAKVDIDTIEQYYLPKIDGDAHLKWLEYIEENNLLQNDSISISEVVKGMVMFNSDANTDFLMNYLGIENINATIRTLGLRDHSEVYPIGGALAIADYINLKENLSETELEKRITKMTNREYINQAIIIQDLMNTNSLPSEVKNAKIATSNFDIQQIWIDRFISATANDYMSLLDIINSRTYFNKDAQDELNHVLEYLVYDPIIEENLNHFGFKNGNISGVLTDARYAEDKEGNKIEIVLMMNDLSQKDYNTILNNIDQFMMRCILDENFRDKVVTMLN
ncbi:hypothetical protein AN644_01715 [Candidatus Epulonipiscium fishelsonii]|nr:hypothetical protein AN644_01715 [Epulopiscium sp. SCG-C06WGA-EpuloA1]